MTGSIHTEPDRISDAQSTGTERVITTFAYFWVMGGEFIRGVSLYNHTYLIIFAPVTGQDFFTVSLYKKCAVLPTGSYVPHSQSPIP